MPGILYCNSGAACTLAVADAALYLVISVFRHFTIAQFGAKTGNPQTWSKTRNRIREIGHNPEGHTVGVVGLGRIGYLVAKKIFLGLGANIVYHDVQRKSQEEEQLLQAQYFASLDDMLAVSDCVVVCAPYFGEKIMKAEQFAKCKTGARFVIVSRGQLMDEAALVDALKSGHLSAAGLDVYENEPNVHPELAAMDNVAMMPHCAGGSIESTMGFERLSMENIESFFATGKALTPVNPEAQG
jgi:lactate dehydrogenase-like 2-hydroxyacid dehydrogenase